jgi:dimethyladenosine transferase 1
MPSIGDLVKLYRLRAIKQLSQNFLMDQNLTNKIVKSAGYINNHYVCEVGPGPGGITRAILNRGPKKVLLIEKDKRFKPTLELLRECAPGKVDIYYGDVLSFNMSRLFPEEEVRAWDDTIPNVRIIGNLPFSISTPLIVRWLKEMSQGTSAWRYGRVTLALTFQHEVAERLVADAAEAQRCRLSIMAQYLCKVYYKFTIPGKGDFHHWELNCQFGQVPTSVFNPIFQHLICRKSICSQTRCGRWSGQVYTEKGATD